jgi:acyl carrier protein
VTMNSLDILLDIWRSVLKVEEVTPDDNFYDLGGDSLTAVRIAEQATNAGILVTQEDLMLADTVGDLANRVVPVTPLRSTAAAAEVPLLPSQLRFLNQGNRSTERYNGVAWFQLTGDLPVDRIVRAANAVVERHEAFRLVIDHDGKEWRGRLTQHPNPNLVRVHELPADTSDGELAELLEQTHCDFELADGGLARFVILDFAPPRPREVLVVLHHLIYDVFSWASITSDLDRALTGSPLAPPAVSYRSWTTLLAETAAGPLAGERARYWNGRPWDRLAPVPVDHDGERTFDSVQVLSRRLSPALTSRMRRSTADRTARDVFVGTLCDVWRSWLDTATIAVDMYGPGRELPGFGTVGDIVGWLAAIDPLVIDFDGVDDTAGAVEAVAKTRTAMPADALGFLALRWLAGDARITTTLAELPQPELYANYRGGSRAVPPTSIVELDRGAGAWRQPHGLQPYKLEVTGDIVNSELVIGWNFSKAAYRPETVELLADQHLNALVTYLGRSS